MADAGQLRHALLVITSLADALRQSAMRHADRPLLDCDGETTTYGQMHERSNRVANALAASGIGPQDHVAYLAKNGPEYFELLFGASKIGAVMVGVNFRLSPPEIAGILNDAEAGLLVVGPEFGPAVETVAGDLKTVSEILVIGEHDRWESFTTWRDRASDRDPAVSTAPDDAAFLLYTSGTTGEPKGAIHTNRGFAEFLPTWVEHWNLDQDTVLLLVLPLFHAGGLWVTLPTIAAGGRIVLHRDLDLPRMAEDIARHRVTITGLVPTILQMLLSLPGVEDTDFSSLRSFTYGGSPMSPELLQRAMAVLGCDFVGLYGCTESGVVTVLPPPDHDPAERPRLLGSCGRALPWVEIRIVDPETGTAMAEGQTGEIWLRSPQGMTGYWNRPEESAATLDTDGWIHTGDAGYLDAEGYLYLQDRIKDLIISGGENVYPSEVERVALSHPGVADVAVIGVPDERWGETVKAIVVRAGESALTGDELVAFCRERLAHYKCPTSVTFMDALPRNASGKILRHALRAPYWAGRESKRMIDQA